MPHLRVRAGTSSRPADLVDITALVNTDTPVPLRSDAFDGAVVARIKGFNDVHSDYFEQNDRKGVSWSIMVQGRFLKAYSADDVLFGNTFDRPLNLPWGSGAALSFMKYIDPTLSHDLTSKMKPWALSPLIATMPYFAHTRLPSSSAACASGGEAARARSGSSSSLYFISSPLDPELDPSSPSAPDSAPHTSTPATGPPFPGSTPLREDTSQLHRALALSSSNESSSSGSPSSSPASSASSVATVSTASSTASASKRSVKSLASTLSSKAKSKTKAKKGDTSSAGKRNGANGVNSVDDAKTDTETRAGEDNDKLGYARTDSKARRAFFSREENRRKVVFGPRDIITTDFCYGFLEFSSAPQPSSSQSSATSSSSSPTTTTTTTKTTGDKGVKESETATGVTLRLPGGLSFDLLRYWDGQPVRFVCCERKREGADNQSEEAGDEEEPWGRVIWCVCVELCEDGEDEGEGEVGEDDVD